MHLFSLMIRCECVVTSFYLGNETVFFKHVRLSSFVTISSFLMTVWPVTRWLNGLAVSALGIRTRGPRFDSRVAPLFHWLATLGKLFTHIAAPVSQLQETGVQKGVFGA